MLNDNNLTKQMEHMVHCAPLVTDPACLVQKV